MLLYFRVELQDDYWPNERKGDVKGAHGECKKEGKLLEENEDDDDWVAYVPNQPDVPGEIGEYLRSF